MLWHLVRAEMVYHKAKIAIAYGFVLATIIAHVALDDGGVGNLIPTCVLTYFVLLAFIVPSFQNEQRLRRDALLPISRFDLAMSKLVFVVVLQQAMFFAWLFISLVRPANDPGTFWMIISAHALTLGSLAVMSINRDLGFSGVSRGTRVGVGISMLVILLFFGSWLSLMGHIRILFITISFHLLNPYIAFVTSPFGAIFLSVFVVSLLWASIVAFQRRHAYLA